MEHLDALCGAGAARPMHLPVHSGSGHGGYAPLRSRFAALLAACLLAPACSKPPDPIIVLVEKPAAPAFDPAKAFPLSDAPRPPVSRQPEPPAVKARAAAIRRDAEAIEAECRQAAGGDWERWQRDTASYRAALKSKIDALKFFDPPRATYDEANSEPLEGKDGFPLFEVGPRAFLQFLYRPETLDTFRKDRSVAVVHRWLQAHGVDLIFVPAPKMTEVYVEHFLDPLSPGRHRRPARPSHAPRAPRRRRRGRRRPAVVPRGAGLRRRVPVQHRRHPLGTPGHADHGEGGRRSNRAVQVRSERPLRTADREIDPRSLRRHRPRRSRVRGYGGLPGRVAGPFGATKGLAPGELQTTSICRVRPMLDGREIPDRPAVARRRHR